MSEPSGAPVTDGLKTAKLESRIKVSRIYLARSRKWMLFADVLLLCAFGVLASAVNNSTHVVFTIAVLALAGGSWVARAKIYRTELRDYSNLIAQRSPSK